MVSCAQWRHFRSHGKARRTLVLVQHIHLLAVGVALHHRVRRSAPCWRLHRCLLAVCRSNCKKKMCARPGNGVTRGDVLWRR